MSIQRVVILLAIHFLHNHTIYKVTGRARPQKNRLLYISSSFLLLSILESMSLKYEPFSEPLHISEKQLFLNGLSLTLRLVACLATSSLYQTPRFKVFIRRDVVTIHNPLLKRHLRRNSTRLLKNNRTRTKNNRSFCSGLI